MDYNPTSIIAVCFIGRIDCVLWNPTILIQSIGFFFIILFSSLFIGGPWLCMLLQELDAFRLFVFFCWLQLPIFIFDYTFSILSFIKISVFSKVEIAKI